MPKPPPRRTCPTHRIELEAAECWNGCEDGYFDGYEDDPLWYDPGDLMLCQVCNGEGYFMFCPECQNEAYRARNATPAKETADGPTS